MRIGTDLDGVLGNFVYAFCSVAWDVYGLKTQWKTYDLGVTHNQRMEIYDYMIRESIFLNIQPYDGTVKVLKEWAKDYEIVYITRRRPGKDKGLMGRLETQTKLWIVQNHFPTGEVAFTQDKLAYCLDNNITVMVEDYLKDARIINEKVLCYLVSRPWNDGEYPHRIESLSEVNLG